MKMSLPSGKAFKAGQAKLAQFAHHEPDTAKFMERMSRPGHPKAPHN